MARYEKVAEAIRQEVSSIIHDELKDPRLGFVTVTRVEMTPDLRFAKIFFSVLGSQEEQLNSKKALDSGIGFIRRLIAQRIQLRLAPEIMFKEDKSGEYSIRIQEVLDEIRQLNPPADVPKKEKRPRKEKQREPRKSSRKNKSKK